MLTFTTGKPLQKADFSATKINKIYREFGIPENANDDDLELDDLDIEANQLENLQSESDLIKQKIEDLQQKLITRINTNSHLNDKNKNKLIRKIIEETYNELVNINALYGVIIFSYFSVFLFSGINYCYKKDIENDSSCSALDIISIVIFSLLTLIPSVFIVGSRRRSSKFTHTNGFNLWAQDLSVSKCRESLIRSSKVCFNDFDKSLFFSPKKSSLCQFSKPAHAYYDVTCYKDLISVIYFEMSQLANPNPNPDIQHEPFELLAEIFVTGFGSLDNDQVAEKNKLLELKASWINLVNESVSLTAIEKERILKLLTSNPKAAFKSFVNGVFSSIFFISLFSTIQSFVIASKKPLAEDSEKYLIGGLVGSLTACLSLIASLKCYIPDEITSDNTSYQLWLESLDKRLPQPQNRCRMMC